MAQHEQLDAMLRRQAENRQQMQTIISAHQERITQRIKVKLMIFRYSHSTVSNYIERFCFHNGNFALRTHSTGTGRLYIVMYYNIILGLSFCPLELDIWHY